MEIVFSKYHGTGNDFICVDNRDRLFPANDQKFIKRLCHRRFGIGSDGLVLIQEDEGNNDFKMRYFNSDGLEGSMCGNGGRCAVHFARKLGIVSAFTYFSAIDGAHKARIENNRVELGMSDVFEYKIFHEKYFVDTGSPHLVVFTDKIKSVDVLNQGKKLRHDKSISSEGVNVNFVQMMDEKNIHVRTYERGVENETWSCGTGAIASAIATPIKIRYKHGLYLTKVMTRGGELEVSFDKKGNLFDKVTLTGPATEVFQGSITKK